MVMQYLFLMYVDRGLTPLSDAADRYGELRHATAAAGVHVAMGRLERDGESVVLRREGPDTSVTSVPIASNRFAPVGFCLLDCADREEALAWASRIPAAEYGSVEVRSIEPGQAEP